MVVVSDTSVISGLLILDQLSILEELFDEVTIPKAVHHELMDLDRFGYDISKLETAWIKVRAVEVDEVLSRQLEKLDIGEIEAITLAKELEAGWLLIDEKKGRRYAEALGIQIIGLLGILVKAKQKGVIIAVKPLIEKLSNTAEFRMSQSLIDLILTTVNEK
ncbi:MAG: DUF3368 domain-containing protein [Bacteroidota bacterium]